MAIRPRIKSAPPPTEAPAEAEESIIAAIINRGGAPAGQESAPPPPPAPAPEPEPVDTDPEKKFTLRLPSSVLAAIEKDAKGRPDRISVNTWLIGAALQRLERAG